jgi:hypothetical protein
MNQMNKRLGKLLLFIAVGLLLVPVKGLAQIPSNTANVALNAPLLESLTVTLTGVPTVNFALVAGGIAPGSIPVPIQTKWVLKPGRTTVTLLGYFATTNALTDGGAPPAYILSSYVFGQVPTGSPTVMTAFTGPGVGGIGTAGASLQLFSEAITGLNKNKTRNDTLSLQIDLTSLPAQQTPAGNYTGTLIIQAVAT